MSSAIINAPKRSAQYSNARPGIRVSSSSPGSQAAVERRTLDAVSQRVGGCQLGALQLQAGARTDVRQREPLLDGCMLIAMAFVGGHWLSGRAA